MKYMGSKARLAKHILPIILKDRTPNQYYIEPFVGGGNLINKVEGNRIGSDCNIYVIEALKLIRDKVNTIPDIISEDYYKELQTLKTKDGITGLVGFSMSFAAKFFGGYRRDVAGTKGCIENMKTQTKRCKASAVKQSALIQGVSFVTATYDEVCIPLNSIIYCDPPYRDTTKYKTDIMDYEKFYDWCREKKKEGHIIYISGYNMPSDFKCVWELKLNNNLNNKKATEKLFTL